MEKYGIRYDGEAIDYFSGIAMIWRVVVAAFGIVAPGFMVAIFISQFYTPTIELSAEPAWWEIALAVLFFVVLPLGFGVLFLAIALIGNAEHLWLDPKSGEAKLNVRNSFRRRDFVAPLSQVAIKDVRLCRDHRFLEDPEIVLEYPGYGDIKIACLVFDKNAVLWAERISALVGGDQPPNGSSG